jgi:hypothetical protein
MNRLNRHRAEPAARWSPEAARRDGIDVPPPRGARRRLPVLALALALPALAAAGPAPEYGPEAEARFLERCAETVDATACRRLMERLQVRLGYPNSLELADGGPAAFAPQRLAAAARVGSGAGQ